MTLALRGTVVSMDDAIGVLDDGVVYVDGDGLIAGVGPAGDPPPPGLGEVTRLSTDAVIYPGLIDLHSHLAYNYRSLWVAPRAEPYARRDQWPRAVTYREEITRPTVALGTAAAKAVLKFAEVKAIAGGTTAIQGSPGLSRPYEGWLVRNVDNETFGTKQDLVFQSVINQDREGLEPYAERMRQGGVFVYHLAEGSDPVLGREFDDVDAAGGLQPGLIGIHCSALGLDRFSRWAEDGNAGAVVWSPFSNLWLYRATTDVVAARDAGLLVCLGSDWGPSGSKNVLGELKVADLWNRTRLGSAFSDEELCRMVTANPGAAMGRAWGDRIGRLAPGLEADVAVLARRRDDPHRNLIESTERHVQLVLVGGVPVFGNGSLLREAGARAPEPIEVGGVRRAISMLDPTIPDADMTWAQVTAALERAREDPVRAFELALTALPRGEEPLRLIPDMPGGEMAEGLESPRDLGPVTIPPIDTLAHDAAYLDALSKERAPILDGSLEGLDAYYGRSPG
jgi:cytosine/adenosine deaminase-related metal-dependent hydrolase